MVMVLCVGLRNANLLGLRFPMANFNSAYFVNEGHQ